MMLQNTTIAFVS